MEAQREAGLSAESLSKSVAMSELESRPLACPTLPLGLGRPKQPVCFCPPRFHTL